MEWTQRIVARRSKELLLQIVEYSGLLHAAHTNHLFHEQDS